MIDNVFELNDPVMRPGVNDVTVNGVSVLTSGNVADIKIPILYGTCTTAADTAAKVAVIDGFDTLKEGMTVHIKFTYSNGAVDPTLAIKSSSSATTTTTAKSIMVYGTTAPGSWNLTSWEPNQVVSFTYDGTYWQMNDRPSQLGASYFYNGLGIHIVADGSDPGISVSQAGYSSSSLDRESLSISTMNRGSISITANDIKIDNTSIVNKVSQVESTANGDYEVILANSTGTTTTKAGVKKSQYLTFNPSTQLLTLGASGDIALPSGSTWDGTNTSLKDTIGNLKDSIGEFYIIHTTSLASQDTRNEYYVDVDFEDLLDAYEDGKVVCLIDALENSPASMYMLYDVDQDSETVYEFRLKNVLQNSANIYTLNAYEDSLKVYFTNS